MQENIPLAPHTVYRIGGPGRFFVEARETEDIIRALSYAHEKERPYFILGAGSNILVADKGFDGVVIKMNRGSVMRRGAELEIGAGVMMAQAVRAAGEAGLAGFEWGIGVPGTIGGSVRGNAGCFGREMKDVIFSVDVLNAKDGYARRLMRSECFFGYRESIFKKHSEWIILSAILRLKEGDPVHIQDAVRGFVRERIKKQDIGSKSCGCIFKNVLWTRKDIDKNFLMRAYPGLERFTDSPSIAASYLIDNSYLKGRRVGKIYISPRHANFFINEGNGRAEEVVILAGIVKDTVRRKFGILLEEEIQYVGF